MADTMRVVSGPLEGVWGMETLPEENFSPAQKKTHHSIAKRHSKKTKLYNKNLKYVPKVTSLFKVIYLCPKSSLTTPKPSRNHPATFGATQRAPGLRSKKQYKSTVFFEDMSEFRNSVRESADPCIRRPISNAKPFRTMEFFVDLCFLDIVVTLPSLPTHYSRRKLHLKTRGFSNYWEFSVFSIGNPIVMKSMDFQ